MSKNASKIFVLAALLILMLVGVQAAHAQCTDGDSGDNVITCTTGTDRTVLSAAPSVIAIDTGEGNDTVNIDGTVVVGAVNFSGAGVSFADGILNSGDSDTITVSGNAEVFG